MSEWPFVPLGDVAEVSSGGGAPQDPNDFGGQGAPFVRAGSLKRLLSDDRADQLEQLSPEVAAKHKLKLFPVDAVLFAKSGMSAAIGLVCRLRWPAYVVNHLAAIVPGEKLDCGFLHHYLCAFPPARLIQDAAYPSIRLSDIGALKIPLPAMREQRRIAAILDQADALRAKRREALAQLDSLTQSIFIEMFGDPVSNPLSWDCRTLDEITNKVTDGEHINPPFVASGMPIVMAGNVLIDKVDLASAKRVESSLGQQFQKKCHPEFGDLLIVGRGATIGRLCRVNVDDSFCLMGSVILVKPNRDVLDSRYLAGMLAQPSMHAMLYKTSGSSAQQAIYLKDVKRLSCPLPSLPLQQTFATRIQAVDALKATHRIALNDLDCLFASLQHRAFRGEL